MRLVWAANLSPSSGGGGRRTGLGTTLLCGQGRRQAEGTPLEKKGASDVHQEAQLKPAISQLDRLGRLPRVRLGAVIAIALAAAFVAWLAATNGSHSPAKNPPVISQSGAIEKVAGTGPVAASVADLKRFAAAVGHPIYWAGPMAGNTYELTQTRIGRVYVRYLPPGVPVGVKKPFLTIATYPFPHAFNAVNALVKNQGGGIKLDHGGIALVDRAYPKSVHLAYPGSDYEVEVFSPSPASSREIVASGQIASIR
jgi:hypothetical protein